MKTNRPRKTPTCTPGKSHFCRTPTGSGSCITTKKQCRYKPKGSDAEAANWIGSKTPRNASTLPANHVISSDSRVTRESLNEALNAIQTEGASERLGQFRQFVDEQGIQAVFNDRDNKTRGKNDKLFNALEQKDLLPDTSSIQSAIESLELLGDKEGADRYRKLIKQREDKLKREYVSSNSPRVAGFTYENSRHVVVLTNSSKDGNWRPNAETFNSANQQLFRAYEDSAIGTGFRFHVTGQGGDATYSKITAYLHEVGHQVDYVRRRNGGPPLPGRGRSNLTRYGMTNDKEWFAEHFTAWMLDAKRYREIDPGSADFFDATMKSVLGSPRRIP